ncbi:MAG: RNA 2'-phosphotransferase [Planctomycetota bacterium]
MNVPARRKRSVERSSAPAPANLVRLSKAMSLILRHRPEEHGVLLDAEGWTSVDELLSALRRRTPEVTLADVEAVVASVEADKQRFSLLDGQVRANYGHSLPGRIAQLAATPPDLLLHGAPRRVLEAILREGLHPMSRQYVHLTTSEEIATRVGGRRGEAVLLEVDAARAHAAGVVFYRANEAFWLVEALAASYLRPRAT